MMTTTLPSRLSLGFNNRIKAPKRGTLVAARDRRPELRISRFIREGVTERQAYSDFLSKEVNHTMQEIRKDVADLKQELLVSRMMMEKKLEELYDTMRWWGAIILVLALGILVQTPGAIACMASIMIMAYFACTVVYLARRSRR